MCSYLQHFVTAFLLLVAIHPCPAVVSENTSPADPICGPQCVQTVLRLYGHEGYDLEQLIVETQKDGVYEGASLRSLEEALEARRIHATPCFVGVDETVEWSFPVIVHLNTDDSLGHFIVARRMDNEKAAIADPASPGGENLDELWFQRSGAIPLTSPRPIRPAEIENATKTSLLGYATLACFAANSLVVLAFVAVRYAPRRIAMRDRPPVGRT